MKIERRLAACAAVPLAVGGASTAVAEPFLVRNQHPVVALFGLPAPLPARLPAPGAGSLAALVNWSNFATTETRGERAYTLDGEVVEARLVADRSFGERFAVHAEVAHRRLDAGSLDGAIERWHDFFGLPNGSRPRLPEDRLLLEYRVGHATPLRVEREAAGLADLPVALGYRWRDDEAAAVASWLSIKAPTGDADELTGSGAVDVALSLVGERTLGARWAAFGQANVAWLGQGDLLAELQEDFAWSVLGGVSWHAWRGLELTAQLEANSAVLDTGLDDLDGAAAVLTFGGSWVSRNRWRFDFGISEDVQVDASPDVVFNFAVRHGF